MPISEIDQVQVSRENVFATKTHDGSEEVSTELKLGYGSCITKKSKLEPLLSFEAKPENSTTDEIISPFASERREKEPIFYNFIPIPEVDQYQCSKEYVFATKTHDESEEVSTELKLGYGTCIPQKRKATENLVNLSLSSTALGAKRMKLNSHEGPNGVSLELKLGIDPWVIKKRIKTSDIGDMSRLLLPADLVKKHILPLWNTERIEKIMGIFCQLIEKIKDGVQVGVWDCDTKSEHQLLFQQWAISGSCYYVLIGKPWVTEFVKRRGLKKGDEIGLYWDQSNSRFNFSILKRVLSN
ncbi:putative B3 domain-containing protein At1g78640 [Fagus crenata]